MTVDNLAARARRLDRLAMGLMKEVVLIRQAADPLLHLDRLAYVEALRGAVARKGARGLTVGASRGGGPHTRPVGARVEYLGGEVGRENAPARG
jgi:hypothetical protein